MYGFLAIFDMHDTCMWFLGYDLSLGWRMLGLTMDFPSLSISDIGVVLWVHFFVFMVGSHVSFSLG